MKIIKDNEELKGYIKDGIIKFDCSIRCDFDIVVDADLYAYDINARNINAWDINAQNIKAQNIKALNINARDINALNINARNINARDINARDINAQNINYHASCIAMQTFKCKSVKGRRTNNVAMCLDRDIEHIKDESVIEEMTVEQVCKALGREIKIVK